MKKLIKIKSNRGMTYVELIVVLSIFSVMTSIVLFNYNGFQAKVDIKVLANEIALKIVEAQKSAIGGKLPISLPTVSPWRPSYGLYFDSSSSNNKDFVYFTDLDQSGDYSDASFCSFPGTGECLDKPHITKNNYISKLDSYLGSTPTPITTPLSITFTRPGSDAIFKSNGLKLTGFNYIQITITSPSSITARVKIYPSGRIQIN